MIPFVASTMEKKKIKLGSTEYEKMVESALRYGSHYWDEIELKDGTGITFAMEKEIPYDVTGWDEDGEEVETDYEQSIYLRTYEVLTAPYSGPYGKE